jgi:hypothetical protein
MLKLLSDDTFTDTRNPKIRFTKVELQFGGDGYKIPDGKLYEYDDNTQLYQDASKYDSDNFTILKRTPSSSERLSKRRTVKLPSIIATQVKLRGTFTMRASNISSNMI